MMALSSNLEDFSLADLFQLMDQGRKSGRLSLFSSSSERCSESERCYHIWFKRGRVVAAAAGLDGTSLITNITRKGWLSQRVVERLDSLAPVGTPLGLTLKTQGALQREQLSVLFKEQMQQLWGWFGARTGRFDLDGKAPLPTTEMTGLSLPVIDVALAGLRYLKNWQALAGVLPAPQSGIQSLISGKPQLTLSALEWQIWEFANGTVDLEAIATQINQSTPHVQQAAFRLMLTGLVKEVSLGTDPASSSPISTSRPRARMSLRGAVTPSPVAIRQQQEALDKASDSLLQNLLVFLRSRA
jgi:hypothetical protein